MYTPKPTHIRIKIGETGPQFLERTGLDKDKNVNRQPAGVNFYDIDWTHPKLGTVHLEHGQHSIDFPRALGVMGAEDLSHPEEGIDSFDITVSVAPGGIIAHDEARQLFTQLLQKLLKAGWKESLAYDTPRLSGADAYQYAVENNMGRALPIDYVPTLEQWMAVDGGPWYLYADGLFMKINIRRDSDRMDPQAPGAYLLSFSIYSKEEEARVQFDPKQRDQWQSLWVEKIKGMKRDRYAKEKALAAQGYNINTGYQEPKIHPADPVEP